MPPLPQGPGVGNNTRDTTICAGSNRPAARARIVQVGGRSWPYDQRPLLSPAFSAPPRGLGWSAPSRACSCRRLSARRRVRGAAYRSIRASRCWDIVPPAGPGRRFLRRLRRYYFGAVASPPLTRALSRRRL